jgi:hypothetical protein
MCWESDFDYCTEGTHDVLEAPHIVRCGTKLTDGANGANLGENSDHSEFELPDPGL